MQLRAAGKVVLIQGVKSVLSTHASIRAGTVTSAVGDAVDGLAYVITDHPILAAGVRRSLQGQYTVVHLTWPESVTQSRSDASLVVLDITGVGTHDVLPVLAAFRSPVRIAISSLERDEVDLYLLDCAGLSRLGALPSLISLTA